MSFSNGSFLFRTLLAAALFSSCSTSSPKQARESTAVAKSPVDAYFLKIQRLRKHAPKFEWPVKYTKPSSFFGWRQQGRLHEGIDLRGPKGTRVYAAEAGRVIYVQNRISGFGKMVIIDHGGKWSTMYAHLTRYRVTKGRRVEKGQLIGLMGKTGRATGVHLHFEIRYGADPVDPMLFLPPLD